MKSNKYFNAGVMIIDLKKWKANDLKNKSLKIIEENKEKLLFWDQDVLNLYFDDQYEPLPIALNFKVDIEIGNNKNNFTKNEKKDVSILHYSESLNLGR